MSRVTFRFPGESVSDYMKRCQSVKKSLRGLRGQPALLSDGSLGFVDRYGIDEKGVYVVLVRRKV